MNKLRKQASAIALGLMVMFSSMQQVWAKELGSTPALVDTEESEIQTEISTLDSVKDSVVQIIVHYVADNGKSYILKSGSGFLINGTTVLTDYNMLSLTQEEQAAAAAYLTTELGVPVSFTEAEGTQVIAAQIGVVMYRDVVISATVNQYSSREMRLGILNVSEELNRTTAVLGDSSQVTPNTQIYALGYKNVTVMQAGVETERLSQRDIKVSAGASSGEVAVGDISYINHTAKISQGNTGGPTVDINGLVVGMNLYGEYGDGAYCTLTTAEMKELLDSCQIAYQESSLSSISAEDIADAKTEVYTVDYGLLDNYILNYSMLEKSDYTEESYQVLEQALEHARAVSADQAATQAEVDAAVGQLGEARAGLIPAKKTNWPFLITLGILILVVITGVVLIILKMAGVIFKKTEPEKLLTLSEMNMQKGVVAPAEHAARLEPEIVLPKPRNSGGLRRGGESGGYKETTVLGVENPAQSEGTVVLGAQAVSMEAYLIRKSNSDKIRIDGKTFTIGKDGSRVNYCIADNPSISRCHAQIQQRDMKYYLSDLQSTNFTYLNGRILMTGEEAELKDKDEIRFSNEEYYFSIRKGD